MQCLIGALVVVPLLACGLAGQTRAQQVHRPAGSVVINSRAVPEAVLARLSQGRPIPPGRYWYDRRSGLWGIEGGPARGVVQAGLRLGGPLSAHASGGRSPVTINGRRLTGGEVQFLMRLVGQFPAGHYWLDHMGNAGRVGGPPLVNLYAVARRAKQGSNGVTRYHKNGRSYLSDGKFTGFSFRGVGGKTTSVFIDH